jgi:hypothetical protein
MRHTLVRPALAWFVLSFIAVGSAVAAPTISSFSPTSGTIGNQVIINGTGFTGATAVTFNGVVAKYTVNSATKITATVPNAASTGQISVTAGGSTGTSTTSFTVTPGMGLSAAVGHPNVSVTVSGAGFHAYSAVDLYFDNLDVALFVSTTTGTLSAVYPIPAWAQPGQHWITFVERGSYWAAQKSFTVQTDWAEQAFNPQGRGVNLYENTINSSNVANLTEAWSGFASGFGNQSPYVVANNTVFVADVTGNIHAYSNTGALLWTASPGPDMQHVNPASAAGRVFFGDASGNVSSYSQTCRSDGGVCTPQWTTNIGSAVTAGLTYFKGNLYAPSNDGSIHTLNPTTGVQGTAIYGYDTTHGAVTTPVAFDADGSFFYGASTVVEYRLALGSYGYITYSGYVSPIAVANGSAYFTTTDGLLHRFGNGNWDVATSGTGCAAAPVLAFGRVYAGGCSSLAAYSPKTGGIFWSASTGQIQGISEANGVIYACEGPYGANVQAYDAYFDYLWTGGYCNSAPEVANGNVYAAFAYISAYNDPALTGALRTAPAISSLRPNYSLKQQPSGSVVVPSTK